MLAREITAHLGGHWYGRYGRCACPVHGGHSDSLQVRDKPTNRDGIDVVCFAGCDWKEIKAELSRQGLIDGKAGAAPKINEAELKRIAEQERRSREKQYQRALATWRRSVPNARELHRYLGHERGIELASLGGIPAALRFSCETFHGLTKTYHPAMVAAIRDATGRFMAVHQTYLAQGGVRKASLDNPKLILGSCAGGAVQLFRIGEEMGVAEGIETALSATELTGIPCWALLSTSGLLNFMVPPKVRRVVIFADFDPVNPRTGNRPGTHAAETLAARLRQQCVACEIRYPPAGLKDFNDALRANRKAAE
jgi:putative DNA primase/helicase